MKPLLILLLLAAPAFAQQTRRTAPKTQSTDELRKIVARYEANVKRAAHELACAKEYAEHGDTFSERQLIVSVCGGDESAIRSIRDAENSLSMYRDGLERSRKALRLLLKPE